MYNGYGRRVVTNTKRKGSRKSSAIIAQVEHKNTKLSHHVTSFEVLKRSYCKVVRT